MLRFLQVRKTFVANLQDIWRTQKANVAVSSVCRLKEIRETKEDKTIIIEGVTIPSPREQFVVHTSQGSDKPCPLCSLGLHLKHTDVLILSQFVRPDGCMLPQRITNLCIAQQRRVTTLVAMAQKAGLMPNLTPDNSKKDPKKRYKWKKFNTYFDEKTINIGPRSYFPKNKKK